MVAAAPRLAADGGVAITHQTGERDVELVRQGYAAAGLAARVEPFLYAMDREMRAADVVVSRAGATTIAELTATGRAAILVPLPTAADDHQRKNAEVLAQAGAAELLEQRDLTGDVLAARLLALAGDPERRRSIGEAARRFARPDAARTIVEGKALELARVLGRTRRIHFVGIGGIGMSGIAELLVNQGYEVSGSDAKAGEIDRAAGRARRPGRARPRRRARPQRRRGRRLVSDPSRQSRGGRGAAALDSRDPSRRNAGRADAAPLRHRGRRRAREDDDDVDDRRRAGAGRARSRPPSSAAG